MFIETKHGCSAHGIVKAEDFKNRRPSAKTVAHEVNPCLIPGNKITIQIDNPFFDHGETSLLTLLGAPSLSSGLQQ
jgi:hypothetical protein